jgi:hypothetical protein
MKRRYLPQHYTVPQNVGTYLNTTRRHNPEDLHIKQHRRKNFETRVKVYLRLDAEKLRGLCTTCVVSVNITCRLTSYSVVCKSFMEHTVKYYSKTGLHTHISVGIVKRICLSCELGSH